MITINHAIIICASCGEPFQYPANLLNLAIKTAARANQMLAIFCSGLQCQRERAELNRVKNIERLAHRRAVRLAGRA